MYKRKVLQTLLYVGLFGGSLDFCLDNFRAYFDKRTYYTPSQEPISLLDLPTLTVCWDIVKNVDGTLIYGKDFSFELKVFENQQQTVTLLENETVITL